MIFNPMGFYTDCRHRGVGVTHMMKIDWDYFEGMATVNKIRIHKFLGECLEKKKKESPDYYKSCEEEAEGMD